MLCQKNVIAGFRKYFLSAVITIALISSFEFSVAQEEFIPPPSRLLTSFSFNLLTGGIILVKARLGNYPDSLNFIMDTGSGGISLDSTTCVDLHLTPELSDKTI